MSVFLYVQKRDGLITRDDLAAAAEQAPHYTVQEVEDGLMVGVPCGDLGTAWLAYLPDTGVLSLQLHEGQGGEAGDRILKALRRFADCVPGAFVNWDSEQDFDPLPWDQP